MARWQSQDPAFSGSPTLTLMWVLGCEIGISVSWFLSVRTILSSPTCSQFLAYPPTLSTITTLIVIKLTLYKEYWKVNFYIRRKYVHENQE